MTDDRTADWWCGYLAQSINTYLDEPGPYALRQLRQAVIWHDAWQAARFAHLEPSEVQP